MRNFQFRGCRAKFLLTKLIFERGAYLVKNPHFGFDNPEIENFLYIHKWINGKFSISGSKSKIILTKLIFEVVEHAKKSTSSIR